MDFVTNGFLIARVSQVAQILQCLFNCLNQFHYLSWLVTPHSWHFLQLFHNFNGDGGLVSIAISKDTENIFCGVVGGEPEVSGDSFIQAVKQLEFLHLS